MRFLKLLLIGEDDFTLEVKKSDENQEQVNANKIEVESFTHELPGSGEETVTLPKSVVEALAAIVKDKKENKGAVQQTSSSDEVLQKLVDLLSENGGGSTRRFLGQRPRDIVTIDKDDVLDFPALFFAHSVSYAIYDDIRGGHVVNTPYGRTFKFKVIERVVDGSSTKNPKYISLSACMVRSKKEAEWLRAHSLNGIKFFEKKSGVNEISADLQEKMVKAHSMISTMDDFAVIQRCNAVGIKIDTMDNSVLRKRLTIKLAEEMVVSESKIRREVLESRVAYDEIMKDKK